MRNDDEAVEAVLNPLIKKTRAPRIEKESTGFFSKLRFKWRYFRYLWRIQLLYYLTATMTFLICITIWLFYFFARRLKCTSYAKCGWFHNYECSYRRFNYMTISAFVFSWFLFTMGILAIVEARMLGIFLHISNREMFNATSKRVMWIGPVVKYIPWVIAGLYCIWWFFLGSNVLVLALNSCGRRLNAAGYQAAINCRLYFHVCCKNKYCSEIRASSSDVIQCNSLNYLDSKGFLVNPTPLAISASVCKYIASIMDTVDTETPYCTSGDLTECFVRDGTSDFMS